MVFYIFFCVAYSPAPDVLKSSVYKTFVFLNSYEVMKSLSLFNE